LITPSSDSCREHREDGVPSRPATLAELNRTSSTRKLHLSRETAKPAPSGQDKAARDSSSPWFLVRGCPCAALICSAPNLAACPFSLLQSCARALFRGYHLQRATISSTRLCCVHQLPIQHTPPRRHPFLSTPPALRDSRGPGRIQNKTRRRGSLTRFRIRSIHLSHELVSPARKASQHGSTAIPSPSA